MERLMFAWGAGLGCLAVAVGAFGAHALKSRLTPEFMQVFEVGVRYHMYHALALLGVAWAISHGHSGLAIAAGWCFIAGTIVFSGSLYVLALSGVRTWGAVTPLGGLLLIVGWVLLLISVVRA